MEYKSKKEKPGLLLHACCAVCASYPIEFLSDKFDTAVLFYNPNIYPPEEYWKRLEDLKIPEDIVYEELTSISTEGREKLTRIKPANIGQAGRISGVSPADICILLMYLGR